MDTLRACLIGVLAAFSATFATAATAETNPVRTHPSAAAQPGTIQILVKLRSTAATSRLQAQAATNVVKELATRSNLTLKQSRQITTGLHLMQVVSAQGETTAATLARLRADSTVESAELDQRRYAHAMPNDPLYVNQWYEQNAQPAAIDATTAWDTTTGRGDIVIADLDTGIRYDHPDLGTSGGARLLAGYDFITDPLIANDGNGRDADASDPGDWITSADAATSAFTGCTVEDSSWHGTRTAGILGAVTNNSTGIAGISWGPKILPVRVLGKCGGLDSDILDGMRWAAGLHVAGVPDNTHPARIINMSLGGSGACTSAEQTVIDEVVAKGVLVVVSAGNEGGPVDSPANCVGVAGIAGLRQAGTKVGFSSLGPQVALSSPAGNCVNASGACLFSIDTTINTGTTGPVASGYTDQLNPNLGTSFSAPIVSAIAALMTSVNSNLQAPQLIARLKEGSKTFPVSSDTTVPSCHIPASSADVQAVECNCTTQTCGAGMANAPGALKAALRPITAVAVPAMVAAGQNVTLSGTGSAAACGHTIVGYAWTNVGNSTNAIQGANTASATVVAPASGSFTVRLTVTDDAGRTDTADVVLSSTAATTTALASANNGTCPVPPPAITVSLTPASASVQAGTGTQGFIATVANTANMVVTWQVNGVAGGNSTVGTITAAGLYTAPMTVPSVATVTVVAVSAADSTRSGSAQVTITAPPSAPGSGGSTGGGGSSTGGGGTGTGTGTGAGTSTTSAGSTNISSGGGGGGAMDVLTLLVGALMLAGAYHRRRAAHRL
jgi:serine protease